MTDYQSERTPGLTPEQINDALKSKQDLIGWAYIIMASLTIGITIGGILVNCLSLLRTKIKQKC